MTQTHSRVDFDHPLARQAYVSHSTPRRLILFVHGFNGTGVGSWEGFNSTEMTDPWWAESDLFFVEYESLKDDITAVADRIRRYLPTLFPVPYLPAISRGELQVRDDISTEYSELVLVGHSLGGLILRRALVDALQDHIYARSFQPLRIKEGLLRGNLRLFSPASAGFRAAGTLGLLHASGVWPAIEMFLRRSSSYTDLQPGSSVLVETRRRTESLVSDPDSDALRARIIWANPDLVVQPEKYDSDVSSFSVDKTTHSSVCKPTAAYVVPFDFVQTGSPW